MTPRNLCVVLLAVAVSACVAPAQYTIKEAKTTLPKELKPAVAKVLDEKAVVFLDDKGNTICEVWFRKELPAKATAEQVKNGLTLREIPETTILGAVRVAKTMTDYRKQKLKEGVYTFRLGFQPMDGDHMGTAPSTDFALLVPADEDKGAEELKPKELLELSGKASGSSHPSVLLLFPPKAKADAAAKLEKDAANHWILTRPVDVKAADQKATLGLMLTLVGVSSAV
jgi:hypothetical protein